MRTNVLVTADDRSFADALSARLSAEPDIAVVDTAISTLHVDAALEGLGPGVVIASGARCTSVVLERLVDLDPRPGAVLVFDDNVRRARPHPPGTRFVPSSARLRDLLAAVRSVIQEVNP